MGEAKKREKFNEGKTASFDLGGPKIIATEKDLRESGGRSGIVRLCMAALVRAKYPQGMKRSQGKIWSRWRRLIDDDEVNEGVVSASKDMIDWIESIAKDDEVAIPDAFVQWREALIDYIEELEYSEASEPHLESVPCHQN